MFSESKAENIYWGQCHKTFLSVIYKCSNQARLGWKSLSGTNTLAYYEN